MSRPTGAEVDRRLALLGRDLALLYPGPSGWWEDADFATTSPSPSVRTVDLDVVTGVAAADQLFVNRLKTQRGELAPLGHPEYGSRHHELIGQPNVARTRALVKLHVLECLSHEPRIARVRRCDVVAGFRRDEVRIEIDIEITGEPNPRLLVVPFNLAVGIESATEAAVTGVPAAASRGGAA